MKIEVITADSYIHKVVEDIIVDFNNKVTRFNGYKFPYIINVDNLCHAQILLLTELLKNPVGKFILIVDIY